MSPVAPRRHGGSATWLGGSPVAVAALVSVVVILGTLWGFGLLDLSGGRAAEPSTAGLVPVPTLARAAPAYTRLTRDHFWDVRSGRLAVVYLPPQAVTREMLVSLNDVIGRVLSHEKTPGYVFTEADFLPKGTREGLVGGIPAGKRAVRLSADRVDGLHGLQMGDRLDLLATLPLDASRGGATQAFNVAGAYREQLELQAELTNWQKQATVRVMVQNGVIIEPIGTRGVPQVQNSLAEGAVTRVRPVQEAVIAIDPDEVARLTEALAVGARITAVPRSGRPDDQADSRTPELNPVSPFTAGGASPGTGAGSFQIVETINGRQRELTAVPRP